MVWSLRPEMAITGQSHSSATFYWQTSSVSTVYNAYYKNSQSTLPPGLHHRWIVGRLPVEGSRVVVEAILNGHTFSSPRTSAKVAKTIMDLAEASLSVAAERFNTRRICTLDSDFYIYRRAMVLH